MTNDRPHQERASRNVCISVPVDLLEEIDEVSELNGNNRSAMVREILIEYMENHPQMKRKKKGWRTQ